MIVFVTVYILMGYLFVLFRDISELDELPGIENPLWKPFLIFFWPVAVVLVGIISFKNYVEEVIEYYKEKRNMKKRNDMDL